jgi:hypothetical protein
MEEDHRHHHEQKGLGAIFLIGIGIIFLLNNFGLLPINVWQILFRLWPVFLILAGVRILAGKSRSAELIVTILGLIVVTCIVMYGLSSTNPQFNRWWQSRMPGRQPQRIYIPQY